MSDKETPPELRMQVVEAIIRAAEFHVLRDRMNAELHEQPTRLSPLTKRLLEVKAKLWMLP